MISYLHITRTTRPDWSLDRENRNSASPGNALSSSTTKSSPSVPRYKLEQFLTTKRNMPRRAEAVTRKWETFFGLRGALPDPLFQAQQALSLFPSVSSLANSSNLTYSQCRLALDLRLPLSE